MVEFFQSKGERHGRKAQAGTQGADGNGLESGPVRSEPFRSLYFWMALRIAWRERGGKSVYYTKGNVAQMWMGIVPRQEKVKRGQIMLPGLA